MTADHLRWVVRAAPLDADGYATVAAHVRHWRARLPAYDLYVPAAHERVVGLQIYGELALDAPAPVRTPTGAVATVLDALDELGRLLPGSTITVAATAVVYEPTPMGFAPRARRRDDALALAAPVPGWVRASTLSGEQPAPEPSVMVPDRGIPERRGAIPELELRVDVSDPVQLDALLDQMSRSALIIILAGLRDRPRSEEVQAVYDQGIDALGLAGLSRTAPTIVLALTGRIPAACRDNPEWLRSVGACVHRDDRTREHLRAIADLPGFAVPIAKALYRLTSDEERLHWLGHPFWRVRLAVLLASYNRPEDRARAVCSVWHGITAAALPVDVKPSAVGSSLRALDLDSDWAALAAPFGGLIPLPPLPSLDDSTRSPCADLRAWSRACLGLPPEPIADAHLVLSDEARRELVAAEADDVAYATGFSNAAKEWWENNRELVAELAAAKQRPPTDDE